MSEGRDSVRGRAERGSGRQVVTLDYFGDRDQRALVENHALLRDFRLPFSAEALLDASRSLAYDALVYVSNLENHPEVVAAMSQERLLLGNDPATLRQVRDWRRLRSLDREVALPETLLPGEEEAARRSGEWLVKPQHSGGGHGIRPWDGEPLAPGTLLQRRIAGRDASAAFVADGRRCVVLGLMEQLIGRPELGAAGMTWCGNILPLALDDDRTTAAGEGLWDAVAHMAGQLTRRFGLRGLNGIDLVVDRAEGRARPVVVEVNPRYTASMELVEQATGRNMFATHLEALAGRLPAIGPAPQPNGPFLGKGIVFARNRGVVPDTEKWTAWGRRDVPYPGETIEAGHPVCTVLARGATRQECWGNLVAAAEEVQQEMLPG